MRLKAKTTDMNSERNCGVDLINLRHLQFKQSNQIEERFYSITLLSQLEGSNKKSMRTERVEEKEATIKEQKNLSY